MSARTFFRYFASKEDILFSEGDAVAPACSRRSPTRIRRRPFAPSRPRSDSSPRTTHRGDLLRLRHRIITSTPSLSTRAAERKQGWEGEVIEYLRASGRADHLGAFELRLLVASATTALRVAIEAWVADDADGGITDLLDAAFRRLRAGFRD